MRHKSFIDKLTFQPSKYLSQNGRGDGKLTALELRTGFERLVTHIARRECSCRAYKCDKIATYGLPLLADAQEAPAHAVATDGGVVDDDSMFQGTSNRSIGSPERDMSEVTPDHYRSPDHDAAQISGAAGAGTGATGAPDGCSTVVADIVGSDAKQNQTSNAERMKQEKEQEEDWTAESSNRDFDASRKPEQQRLHHRGVRDDDSGVNGDGGGGGNVTTPDKRQHRLLREVSGGCSGGRGNAVELSVGRHHDNGSVDQERELHFEEGEEEMEREETMTRKRRGSVDRLNAGGPVACRKHALEGMVYLGQR